MLRPRQNVSQVLLSSWQWRGSIHRTLPPSRLFMQQAQLLLITHPKPRPQLPYLYSGRLSANSHNGFNGQLGRLISTERRKRITAQIKYYSWIVAGGFVFALSYFVLKFGTQQAALEQAYPSPAEWSYLTRSWYRMAKDSENPENPLEKARGSIGRWYSWALQRLEKPDGDGIGIKSTMGEGEDLFVEGIGKTGQDISSKSEEWRRGYHEVLMGAARAAEQLDGWVWDKKQRSSFPRAVVIGPSNPDPLPSELPGFRAPREEDCQEPAYKPPEYFYTKLLTTQGFTSRQKLEAALAYADWLEFSGARGSAEEMYAWALDIATSNLPYPSASPNLDPDSLPPPVIDKKTAIINPNATNITNNVLLAANTIASYHARSNNLAAALPIFISILRAQQSLPPPDPSILSSSAPAIDTSTWIGLARALLTPPLYGPPPPTGDEPATRSPASVCAEAGTMARIGEILFASSPAITPSSYASSAPDPSELKGLSWTRDAIDLAESTFRSLPSVGNPKAPIVSTKDAPGFLRGLLRRGLRTGSPAEREAKERCAECLMDTMQLWRRMVGILDDREVEAERLKELNKEDRKESGGWVRKLWGGSPSKGSRELNNTESFREEVEIPSVGKRMVGRWQAERIKVSERDMAIRLLLRQEGMSG